MPVEVLDARKLPAQWKSGDFDDSAWQGAQILRSIHIGGFARSQPPTDPYGPLYPRPIAALAGEIVVPVSVKAELLQGVVDTTAVGPAARIAATLGLPSVPSSAVGAFPMPVEFGADGAARIDRLPRGTRAAPGAAAHGWRNPVRR